MSEPVPEPQPQQEAERPEWLMDKFKTVEDQARSYSEAERRLVELQTQIDQQREEFSSALSNIEQMQQSERQQTWNPNEDPLIQNYQRAIDDGDAQAMLAMQLELNRQVMRQELDQLRQEMGGQLAPAVDSSREMAITMATERVSRKYDNWDELAPRIGEFLQANQNLIPQDNSIDSFERILDQSARIILGEERFAANQSAEQERQAKLAQQGLTGQGAQVRDPVADQAEWDRIKSIPLGGYAELFRPK